MELVAMERQGIHLRVRDGLAGRVLSLIRSGLADKCEIQVAYAIGVARPVSLMVNTFGAGNLPEARLEALVQDIFDLRPKAIILELDLLRPIYRQTAAYGHFGREESGFTWEITDKVEQLRDAGG